MGSLLSCIDVDVVEEKQHPTPSAPPAPMVLNPTAPPGPATITPPRKNHWKDNRPTIYIKIYECENCGYRTKHYEEYERHTQHEKHIYDESFYA
jgi:Zn ribbon nucleic-acid-binding protein